MATQDDSGIPLSIDQQQQRFTLLELPPEVLELLSAPNPPQLSIKSLGLTRDAKDEQKVAKSSHAVLCTDSKTFELRQVQTSNSVHILQPRYAPTEEGGLPVEGLASIAQCGSTLEAAPSLVSPHEYLKDALPIWRNGADLTKNQPIKRSKTEIFSNLPCSNAELQRAWDEMIAFEAGGCSLRPGLKDLLSLWRNIMNTATADGFDWSDPTFRPSTLDSLYESLHDYDETSQVLRELFDALLVRLSGKDSRGDAMDVDSVPIDRNSCARLIGQLVLEASVLPTGTCKTSLLIDEWQRHLPAAWSTNARLELIEDLYIQQSENVISLKDPALSVFSDTHVETPSVAQDSSGPLKSRKWHERFGKGRR